ncbi:MAG TPA: glycoside hydrolase family 15 protein [Anaeromyxobacteraceae bacterium]|nr:glycoside hydrolase family 15 protein [Anaeromyxobacteraceae bacterium]
MAGDRDRKERPAPGWPGSPGRWTSAGKSGVGTALGGSAIWFTLSHGILNEVYAPRMDQAATRDLGLVVTSAGFFSEEKRHTQHVVVSPVRGCPYYHLTNTCNRGRYRIEKEVIADPARPVVLQRIRFTSLSGQREDYRLHALLAPHLNNRGAGNTAWLGEYKGLPVLLAARDGHALSLISSSGFRARSVGFVGVSDGWQDLSRHGRLAHRYTLAENGNVALCGELEPCDEIVLALGYGRSPEEAAHQGRASLAEGFEALLESYKARWVRWQAGLAPAPKRRLHALSAMVVKIHQSKHVPGAILASLAVPWGFSKGDGDLGGYHLVWPRDMVEAAGGLLAAGAKSEAREALVYLEATQEADGHWPQNMWTEGRPYWPGLQMDETALPILLVDLAQREKALAEADLSARGFWPMVKRAASYLVKNGPVTPEDRWEEDGGYTPYTLAAEIAALLAAADMAERAGEPELAPYLRETADAWNDQIERWLFVRGSPLAAQLGVNGFYVRITPADVEEGDERVRLKNRPLEQSLGRADAILSTDALALVRFGLRAADDPRMKDTVRAIDALLKVELPFGPAWHRYNGDGYGEHEDGSPFDGTGLGRAWPLLTGERGHYALAARDRSEAERLLATLEASAGEGGLLPEQSWDSPGIPARELFFGRPAGSAMPLVWAHAEYLKLVRSLEEGVVFDMPRQTLERYVKHETHSRYTPWRFNHKIRELPAGRALRIETLAPATVHYSFDGWQTARDLSTAATGLGVHFADLATGSLPRGSEVLFTFYWPLASRWEGEDFAVKIP